MKITKKRSIFSIFIVLIACILAFTFNHSDSSRSETLHNEKKAANSTINSKESQKDIATTTTTAKAPDKPVNVYSLGKPPFESGQYITFHNSNIPYLLNLQDPENIIVNKEYLTNNNKDEFLKLTKEKHHTVLIYGNEINAEDIVGYLDGIVSVVPLDASLSLKFQAYGVTTLNNILIPIFVSTTQDQKDFTEESFGQLFNKLDSKNNK